MKKMSKRKPESIEIQPKTMPDDHPENERWISRSAVAQPPRGRSQMIANDHKRLKVNLRDVQRGFKDDLGMCSGMV